MSKLYFIGKLIIIKIKSLVLKEWFKIFGMKIGSRSIMSSKPIIIGYLNKIEIGNKCSFYEGVRIVVNKEGNLKICNNTLVSNNVNINAGTGDIYIGSNTMIAANTYIINNDHNVFDKLSVRNSGHITKRIYIEDNVWIGANCVILKGVKIGEGAIIGAGSIVTKDVKPYSINFGSPCKFNKFRFTKDELNKKLLEEGYDKNKINSLINDEMEMA